MTTIATWNLHHTGKEARIPPEVVALIEQLKPHVLVLTEYVDRGGRTDFAAALEKIGYPSPKSSDRGLEPRQNQVLIVSKVLQTEGILKAPDVDEAARTNFLCRFLPDLDLHVVGFRVPYYQAEDPLKLAKYWRQFTRRALEAISSRVVFIGDFTVGRTKADAAGQTALGKLVKAGYRMIAEEGGLDRALVSPSVTVRSFSVIEAAAGCRLTGKGGLSDHPMQSVEVE